MPNLCSHFFTVHNITFCLQVSLLQLYRWCKIDSFTYCCLYRIFEFTFLKSQGFTKKSIHKNEPNLIFKKVFSSHNGGDPLVHVSIGSSESRKEFWTEQITSSLHIGIMEAIPSNTKSPA